MSTLPSLRSRPVSRASLERQASLVLLVTVFAFLFTFVARAEEKTIRVGY